MVNPYMVLGGVIAALVIFLGGFQSGRHWESADALANVVAAQNAAIERANQDAIAETERAVLAAKAEADARAKAREVRHKGELDAARKANPACNRDAESHSLLIDAIRAANSQSDATGKLPDAVRSDAGAFGWFRSGGSKLGIPSGGGFRPLPETAR